MKVTIYSTPTCPYCNMAKDFLKKNKIEYTEIDVATDKKAAEEMTKKSGQMGVPVIEIEKDGKAEIVLGFDQGKLSDLLEIK